MLVRTQKKCLSIPCKRLIFIRAPTSVMMGLIRGSRADLCHSLDFITVRTAANITPTCQCWFSVSSNIIITRHSVDCSTRQPPVLAMLNHPLIIRNANITLRFRFQCLQSILFPHISFESLGVPQSVEPRNNAVSLSFP